MPHLLLIVEPLGQREARGLEGGQQAYQQMLDFTEELRAAGVLIASSALSSAATRLERPGGGEPRLIDGPFAEAKEVVGGYAIVEARSRYEALALAQRVVDIHVDAGIRDLEMEVRPFGMCTPDAATAQSEGAATCAS